MRQQASTCRSPSVTGITPGNVYRGFLLHQPCNRTYKLKPRSHWPAATAPTTGMARKHRSLSAARKRRGPASDPARPGRTVPALCRRRHRT